MKSTDREVINNFRVEKTRKNKFIVALYELMKESVADDNGDDDTDKAAAKLKKRSKTIAPTRRTMANENDTPPVLRREESDDAASMMPNLMNMQSSAVKMQATVLAKNENETNGQAVESIQTKDKVDQIIARKSRLGSILKEKGDE